MSAINPASFASPSLGLPPPNFGSGSPSVGRQQGHGHRAFGPEHHYAGYTPFRAEGFGGSALPDSTYENTYRSNYNAALQGGPLSANADAFSPTLLQQPSHNIGYPAAFAMASSGAGYLNQARDHGVGDIRRSTPQEQAAWMAAMRGMNATG